MLIRESMQAPPSGITLPDPVTSSDVLAAAVRRSRRRLEFARGCARICSIRRGGVDGSANKEESPQLPLD